MNATANGVKCGNRKHNGVPTYHASAAEVRACFSGTLDSPKSQPATFDDIWGGWSNDQTVRQQLSSSIKQATTKQVDFIMSLSADLGRDVTRSVVENFSRSDASEAITRLLAAKDEQRRNASEANAKANAAPYPSVEAGRYAIDIDGTTKFYKVDRPTEGRWAGRTFVKVQASDDFHPQRGVQARRVLEAIALDPKAAMLRYGLELGKCGHCGRTLTDEDSRARGIGPVCAGKLGW